MKNKIALLLLLIIGGGSVYSLIPRSGEYNVENEIARGNIVRFLDEETLTVNRVDSLQAIVEDANDRVEVQFRTWFIDSLKTRLPKRDSTRIKNANLNSRNRASFFDTLSRFEKGLESRKSVFLDSSFNPPAFILIHSRQNLIVIREQFNFQRSDESYRGLFALDSSTRTAIKFRNTRDFDVFVANEASKGYQWEKSHGTNYFVSSVTGNDSDDGLSWANAWLTLGKTNGALSGGDTVFTTSLTGSGSLTNFTETFSPTNDGTSGNLIVMMDSTMHANNWSPASMDTTWNTKINATGNSAIALQGDDFWKIIGLWGVEAVGRQMDIGGFCDDDTLINLKSSDHEDGTGALYGRNDDKAELRNAFISCLAITGSQDMDYGFKITADFASSTLLANNTVLGTYTIAAILLEGTDGILEMKSNIFENTSSTAADLILHTTNTALTDDWDNNLFNGPSLTNFFNYNGTTGNTIAAYRTQVQADDADGEANAINSDPALQAVATSAYILTTSPASGAGEDVGFGDNIGYFQKDVTPPSGERRIINLYIR